MSKENERPEDLAPGRLIETFGICKYCRNSVMIKADRDATEKEKNEMASYDCSCKEGQAARAVIESVRIMTDKINDHYDLMPDSTKKAIIASLKPIAQNQIQKANFKINETATIQVYKAANGLNVRRIDKSEEIIEDSH